MRIPAALAAFLLLATPAPPSLFTPPAIPRQPFVDFEALPRGPADWPDGELRYLGGWMLTSNHPRFGGLSALHVDGAHALALSDRGFALAFALPGRGGRSPLTVTRLADGPDIPGEPLSRDSESLAVLGANAWVGFERSNAVWRYTLPGWDGVAGQRPAAMRHWSDNGGAEAMLRLTDGRFLILSERTGYAGGTEALLDDHDPSMPGGEPRRLLYRAPTGFLITDAAQLSDGRLLFLNRRVSVLLRFTAVLTVSAGPPFDGQVELTGREIARFEPPAPADNMEALAVTRENGRDTIWVATDDNFSPLQRTLLLKFALSP